MGLKLLLSSERRTSVAMALVFLPWIVVVLFIAGSWAALNFCWYAIVARDNDLIFSTTNPETLRDIAKTRRVRWLVARPGTDIALPRPLPTWLAEQQNCGTLKVYRIL